MLLEGIEMARSECATKYKSKASYNTVPDLIKLPDLINLFGNDWKDIRTLIEKLNIYICKSYCID